MHLLVIFSLWIFYLGQISGHFDANFTMQNVWGRLPSQSDLRTMIQCISGDDDPKGIKFSRKVDTGQGSKLPKPNQQFPSGQPQFARILLMPGGNLNRFGAFQCKLTRQGIETDIVTLKLPPEGMAELDAASPYIVANRGDNVTLEVIEQKKLNVTLKWRHNGGEEITFWENQTKVQLSNVQESDGGIYECYYDGRRSESVHAILRLIVRGCPAEFYGGNCENECPPCYNGGICHDKWGVCVCPAGFTGENCEQACGGNNFGGDCAKHCAPVDDSTRIDEGCALYLFCKPDPYGCSCAPGFKGSSCKDHCEPGWYGADCKQRCHCFHGSSACNRITGACEGGCQRGWRGAACQIEDPDAVPESEVETTTMAYCPQGTFGASCEKYCHCAGNEACNIVSGHCPTGCEGGWGGPSCSVCSPGRFGHECESTCHCVGGDRNCDPDGFCLSGCEAGWAGFECQNECTAGRFGVNCASVCHCQDGPSACDRYTGECAGDCVAGFMGPDCQRMCSYNKYGSNCVHTCTCSNGGQCSRIDGKCSCEGRWRGTTCNESEPQIIAATDEEVNVGQYAYISCNVDAIPEPTMSITSDKFPALRLRFVPLVQNQYQATAKVTPQESGSFEFYCTARNKHGYDQKVITLSTIDPPRLLQGPELQSTSNTSLQVKWKEWEYEKDEGGKKDDIVEYIAVYRKIGSTRWIKGDTYTWKTDRFAALENLEPDTEYEVAVKCRRAGKGGEGELSLSITVKTNCGDPLPNAIPQGMLTEKVTSSSVKLTWQHPSDINLKCTLTGYRVEYYLASAPSETQIMNIDDTTNEIELNDLDAYSAYVVRLFPATLLGHSRYFSEITIRTAESTPDPVRDLTCSSVENSGELLITWKEPSTTRGVIIGYNVSYRLTNRGMCVSITDDEAGQSEMKSIFSTNTQVTLVELHPYSQYQVIVRAKTSAGEGNETSTTGQTTESIPAIAPPNVRLTSKGSTDLEFKWDPIPCEQANGIIVEYEYKILASGASELAHHTLNKRELGTDIDNTVKKVNGLGVIVEGLEPYKRYGFLVRARTKAGAGNFSEALYETTERTGVPEAIHNSTEEESDEDDMLHRTDGPEAIHNGIQEESDDPSAPLKVTVVRNDKTSLEISWEDLEEPNGTITGYKITYVPLSSVDPAYNISTVQAHEIITEDPKKRIILNYLHPSTQYAVEISPRTNASYGSPVEIKCWTVIDDEYVRPQIEIVDEEVTNESIPIIFSTVGKSSVQKYQVIVEYSRNKHGIDESLLSDYHTAVVQRGLPYYIAAELDPGNMLDSGQQKFIVGDKKVWGEYQNVHLNPGHNYRIRIRRLFGKGQDTKSILSAPQRNISVPYVGIYNSDDEYKIWGMHLILFSLVLAFALVLLIASIYVAAVYVCRKRERRKESTSERSCGISESMTWSIMYKVPESEAVDGPLVSDGYKVMHGYENVLSLKKVKKNSKTSIGIKVENLPEYVHNAKADGRLADEFQRLVAGQTAAWTVARKSENLKKNRYGNILPYDRHRVVLHFDQGPSGSDYINASCIDGYRRPKEYIVTQGPLDNTISDFWRMIWQESVPVIVMVTELVEKGKPRCAQYWPEDSMVCGKLQILLIHSEQNTNFLARTILIRSMEEGKTHRVHQYQFTEWPDKTLPSNPCFLIKMMKRIRKDHPVLGGPMVVHCSAGAGRSGIYVALDTLTQQAEEEKRVDIFRFVNCSRLQRINLVQTLEQYVFIHEALLEAIMYEDTSIPLQNIAQCLIELDSSSLHDNSVTILRQFEMLNRNQKKVDVNMCSDALSLPNVLKNRYPTTVPGDAVRIRLESNSDEDYINAVKVNSYLKKDAFIVTQMPLQHTVEDFWDLVYQEKSSLLLMLNDCNTEYYNSNTAQYWPSTGQASYGKFEVQVVTFEDQGEVIIRIMRLLNLDQPHDEPRKVIQLQYKSWKDDLLPAVSSMLNLVHFVELWYSRSSGGPITVHCLDGAVRSGLFCAVSYICGQVKAEGIVDVFEMAKDIRINRPECLSTLEQFTFCFQVAHVLGKSIRESYNINSITRKKKLSCYD